MERRLIALILLLSLLLINPFNIYARSSVFTEGESSLGDLNYDNYQQSANAEISWSMAGANPQRTSWVPEGVDPSTLSDFGVQWYRPIEAYIGQHVQLITARDKVYVSTARGVYALDTATGNEVWRFDTEMPMGHSPTVFEGVLYVGSFDKRVYALNADTGSLIWTFEGAKAGFSTNPLVVDGKVLLGSRDGYFYALNKDTGSLLWQYPSKSSQPLGPILYSAAYKDGKVFFASNDNYGYALDANNGALLWKSNKMPGDGYQAWWPVVYGNYVVFSSALAYVFEGDPGTQSIRNVIDPSDPYYAKMYNFQYSDDFIKTVQRDDVFHQGEPDKAKLGPVFTSGGSDDSTGTQWGWGNGKSVVNAAKVTEYLE
ncbi:MAG: PQQ-like beta-propeller repeat protein, partial [Anaerolineae bacterium]|nr:PQQ-like beta-propeller repeat protein [Anaerolineae bacterium]